MPKGEGQGLWKHDQGLLERLQELVRGRLHQKQLLVQLRSEFPGYQWRRLKYFEIKKHDYSTPPAEFMEAVKEIMQGPGELLGYRSVYDKLRQERNILVTEEDVRKAMNLINPELVKSRRLFNNKRKKFHKRQFKSKGPNWLWSIDGHDKLSGKNKSEFPFGIHGCIDSFSRKIIWLTVWPSNCMPELPGRLFHQAVSDLGYIPQKIRSDRGGENVIVAAMMNFLRNSEEGYTHHIFGSSTTNQVIEQWWYGFRQRHGEYFKTRIHQMYIRGNYDGSNSTCRVILGFLCIPLIQTGLDSFKERWNAHKIRKQNIYRPCGVPDYMYNFPEEVGGEQCGIVPDPADLAYIDNFELNHFRDFQFITPDLKKKFESILMENQIFEVTLNNAFDCYMILWNNFKTEQLDFCYS